MELKNAMNILFAKFSLNYRVLLYFFIVISIIVAISVSIIIPSFNKVFRSEDISVLFTELKTQFSDFVTGNVSIGQMITFIKGMAVQMADALRHSNAPAVFWATFSLMLILMRFAVSFCYPVITDVVNSFMSSNMKYGFMSNMVKNARLCLNYAFFHTIFSVAADVVIILIIMGFMALFLPLINVFAFTIGLVIGVLLTALRLTVSAGVLPEMIVSGETNYFRAVKKSVPSVKKNAGGLFGAFTIATFAAYCLLMLLTFITFGIAFFVLSAMYVTAVHILQLVFWYGGNNMRYYTDCYTIVNTAPIEERTDLMEDDSPERDA